MKGNYDYMCQTNTCIAGAGTDASFPSITNPIDTAILQMITGTNEMAMRDASIHVQDPASVAANVESDLAWECTEDGGAVVEDGDDDVVVVDHGGGDDEGQEYQGSNNNTSKGSRSSSARTRNICHRHISIGGTFLPGRKKREKRSRELI